MRRAFASWLAGGWVAAGIGGMAALALAPVPGSAQPDLALTPPPPAAAGALPEVRNGELRVGLNQAVRLAIRNNLDVELISYDPLIAEKTLAAAWGAFDPEAFAQGGKTYAETPVASAILPGQDVTFQRIWNAEGGVRGLIPWLGGAYSLSYGGSQTNTDQFISTLSPSFESNLMGSIEVPLLRGLFWSEPWTAVRLARVGVDASADQFRADLMDVVRDTEDAYWNLIAARDARRVAQKSLETAQALLEQTQAQYEVGVVSKVEVVQAEAGVADREFNLISVDAAERNGRDAFVDAVLGPYLAPDSEIKVELLDPPEDVPVRDVDPEAATERAFANRPEVSLARRQIEQREIELKFASNQRLPQVDVVGSYGYSGLAGRLRQNCTDFTGGPCDPPTVGSDWADADRDFFSNDAAKNYAIQGVFSIPLGNVRARSDYDKARLELRRAETQLSRLEQSIVSEIRRAARNLLAALEGIEAAERGVAAAAEQLRAERVRLEYGESTPFDVLQREEDLVTAENQRILAQRTYHNAITALERAQGTILERNAIVIDRAGVLR